MTVSVVSSYEGLGKFTVRVKQGVQSFCLDYHGTKDEATWYAKMFRLALQRHDAHKRGVR